MWEAGPAQQPGPAWMVIRKAAGAGSPGCRRRRGCRGAVVGRRPDRV